MAAHLEGGPTGPPGKIRQPGSSLTPPMRIIHSLTSNYVIIVKT